MRPLYRGLAERGRLRQKPASPSQRAPHPVFRRPFDTGSQGPYIVNRRAPKQEEKSTLVPFCQAVHTLPMRIMVFLGEGMTHRASIPLGATEDDSAESHVRTEQGRMCRYDQPPSCVSCWREHAQL